MSYPADVGIVRVYAGDTLTFPGYRIKEGDTYLDLSEWVDWAATWRRTSSSGDPETLTVDVTQLGAGRIALTASAEQTRAMGGAGRFDVQATRDGSTRTWVTGRTTYVRDVGPQP